MNVRFGDEVIPVSGGVMPARSPAETITAEIPYLRSELQSVQVEYESRILDDRTVERRAMPVRDGRTAAVPPSLAREGLELVSWPSPIARERLDELVAAEAAADHAPDRVRLLGRDDPGDPRAHRRSRRVAAPRVDRAVQREGEPRTG